MKVYNLVDAVHPHVWTFGNRELAEQYLFKLVKNGYDVDYAHIEWYENERGEIESVTDYLELDLYIIKAEVITEDDREI